MSYVDVFDSIKDVLAHKYAYIVDSIAIWGLLLFGWHIPDASIFYSERTALIMKSMSLLLACIASTLTIVKLILDIVKSLRNKSEK